MRSLPLMLFSFLCAAAPLYPQEAAAPPLLLYPLAQIRDADIGPQWPSAIPPDSFRAGQGRIRSLELQAEDTALRLERSRDGRATVFPLLFMDEPVDAEILDPSADGSVRIRVGAEPPLEVEYSMDDSGNPTLAVGKGDGDPMVAVFSYMEEGGSRMTVAETQYGPLGTVVGYIEYGYLEGRLRSRRIWNADGSLGSESSWDYDAQGRIVRIASPEGETSVHYDQKGRVRSIARGVEARELQWDERDYLVRERGTTAEGQAFDHRHAYLFDQRGNWIERRTTAMAARFGVLAPEPGPVVRRSIRYWE